MSKKKIALLFGGASSEHEVSCMSVASVYENIDKEKYEPLLLGITKGGEWFLYSGHDQKLRESFDFVTARAVANLSVLSEYCLPLVRVGGVFAPMKTAEAEQEIADAKPTIAALGGKIREVKLYELPIAGGRSVAVIDKERQTPQKYPRQGTKISKKPIK